jgi:ketosteroid isomerase-like protein
MSQETIRAFYAAFAELDGAAMAACYADDARFEDEVFSLVGRDRIGGMWTMLTDAVRARGREDWRLSVGEVTDRSAHWEAEYRFSATGRRVHNRVDATFGFDGDGLITRHVDRFDFWRWSRQALGPAGWLLGWTPWLHTKVCAQAQARLALHLARRLPG